MAMNSVFAASGQGDREVEVASASPRGPRGSGVHWSVSEEVWAGSDHHSGLGYRFRHHWGS